MSITAFNIRLTSLSSFKWQVINWTFFVICGLYTLIAFFLNIFQCDPAGGSFDILILARSERVPRCVGVANMNTILRAINITLDYCLLAVPVIVLWKVRMSWIMKGRLFVMFGVGGLACVGSVMTLVSKFHLKTDALCKLHGRQCVLSLTLLPGNYTGILGWSLVELTLGVLAASLPTLAFFLPKSMKTNNSIPTAEVRVSHTHSKNYDSARRVNTKTSFHLEDPDDLYVDTERTGIVRTQEVELSRRQSSDLDSERRSTSLYDLTKDQKHSSWFNSREDNGTDTDLPIMGTATPVRNFSRPESTNGL